MSVFDNKRKHWFTVADALILVVVVALLVGSAVIFLFPREEKTTAVPVQASIIVYTEEGVDRISEEEKLFLGEEAIGTVQLVDKSANYVVILVDAEKDEGVYYLGGNPIRINGTFTLETRLCKLNGVVKSIGDKEE